MDIPLFLFWCYPKAKALLSFAILCILPVAAIQD